MAAGIAIAIPVAAQDQGADLSLAALMDIKLQTGSFLELDLSKSPLSMTVIDRTQVGLSGARNLSELLEIYVPGFQYMFNKWNGTLWGMRGVANDRNTKFIVLVNGHKMNTEARDGFFQETTIGMLGDVERVEVLRGPAGLVYGTGAIAGIVNIVTRSVDVEGTTFTAKAGASSHEALSKEWQVISKIHPAEGQDLVLTLGSSSSDGIGRNRSRIWGQGSWPFASGAGPKASPQGAPSDGSYGEKDGDWKASVDYKWDRLRIYARATHQTDNSGGFFPQDPWPEVVGNPDTNSVRVDDGHSFSGKDPFWSGVESYGTSRRLYIADNVLGDVTYEFDVGADAVKLHGAFDGNTNRIAIAPRLGYEASYVEDQDKVDETFGERRYTAGATYLLKGIPNLQVATGYELRIDDIGDDLTGRNAKGENPLHKVVSDVLYVNNAVYTEGFYDVTDKIGISAGLRWDGHTRTIDDGGIFSPKAALVLNPVAGHTIKLIAQSSANNGSADNYDYNRWHFDELGMNPTSRFYERPFFRPTDWASATTTIVPAPTVDQLHSLKPERTTSFELASTHVVDAFTVSPSVSFNMVQDLLAWNQDFFRIVNVGEYNYLDIDFDVKYQGKLVTIGANHTFQKPLSADIEKWKVTLSAPGRVTLADSIENGLPGETADQITARKNRHYMELFDSTYVNGRKIYVPKQDANNSVSKTIYPVKEQVTADGDNFLNLATNVTKVFVDYKALSWLTLHSDVRVFWGLVGRQKTYDQEEAAGWNYQGIQNDAMAKWDASAHMALPKEFQVSFFVYDILGSDDPDLVAHTLRWQQQAEPAQKDLYGVDYRSYAVKVEKSF